MHLAAMLSAVVIILVVVWEAFETVILPRRIQRKLRFTRFFYLTTWTPWRALAQRAPNPRVRETMLSFYGPISLVVLFATWAMVLTVAFAVVHWGLGSHLKFADGEPVNFWTDFYLSGTTLFTLGLGDVTPTSSSSRFVAVLESAMGFGLIALAISYLPTFYLAFSRREVNISLLDARAGSPPTASEFFRRYRSHGDPASAGPYLAECERWASELLESHMSYPALCYYRSQHANQSWISGLTTMLDICVLVELCGAPQERWQAELTFAMARHAVMDLVQVFHLPLSSNAPDRLPQRDWDRLQASLNLPADQTRMRELRAMYEPSSQALAGFLAMDLAPWVPPVYAHDNWSSRPEDV